MQAYPPFGVTKEMQDLLNAVNQAQQQQEPQTPADYVTEQTIQGAEAKKAADTQQQVQDAQQAQMQQLQAQMPQQEQLLNPVSKEIIDQLLAAKRDFENADVLVRAAHPNVTDEAQLGAAADALRLSSHAAADDLRQLAANLNVDLTGYENVGYEEAANKLRTQATKEIMGILSKQGKYGRSSDRYFNDEYMKLAGEGKSAREARRIAGDRAQRYQDDRVTYLRGAYNTYGRAGNYTNDAGVLLLQEIASEMPEVANVYATAYKLPAQLQDRLEKMYDDERGYKHAHEMSDKTFQQNWGLQGQAFNYNTIMAHINSALRREDALFNSDVDFQQFMRENNFTTAQAKELFHQKLQNGIYLVTNVLGLKGAESRAALANYMGINVLVGKNGKAQGNVSANSTKNAMDFYAKLVTARDSYAKQREEAIANKDNNALGIANARLQEIDAQLKVIESLEIQGIAGIPPQQAQIGSDGKLNITGNWGNDAIIFEQVDASMKKQGYSVEQRRQGLYEIAIEHGYTPEYAQKALGISADEVAKWQR